MAMGSPLGPVLANEFMGHHENKWINKYHNSKPVFYTRYVDDIFCIFENETDSSQYIHSFSQLFVFKSPQYKSIYFFLHNFGVDSKFHFFVLH